jgi:glycerol-3-phosphate acyltransferase PlsY
MSWPSLIVCCLIAYLIGAIPFSWLFVRVLKGIDLRTVGSGNLGSTNAARVLGVPLGLVIQALDILKGWLPVFVLTSDGGDRELPVIYGLIVAPALPEPAIVLHHAALLIGLSAVLGHMFPVYIRFRGGKGVNTTLGVFFALAPKAVIVALAVGLTVMAVTRYVSLCSITGAIVLQAAVVYFYPHRIGLIVVTAIAVVLVIFLHRSNVRRLLAGTEPRLGKRTKPEETHESGSGNKPA